MRPEAVLFRSVLVCASSSVPVDDRAFENLPGAEIVLSGIADLRAGRLSTNALAVQSAAPRLQALGFEIEGARGKIPAAHQLYEQLHRELGDAAHSRYNAILNRVTSFAHAAERAISWSCSTK